LFGRDKAIFYGSLKLSNAFTLGNIGNEDLRPDKPEGDDEKNFTENAKYVNYKELKESGDGTMFYDKDNKIVVIKIEGEWMQLKVKKLPKKVKYAF
jgi:hypothetical protein